MGKFFAVGAGSCAVGCGYSSIPGLDALDANSTVPLLVVTNQKRLQILPNVPVEGGEVETEKQAESRPPWCEEARIEIHPGRGAWVA